MTGIRDDVLFQPEQNTDVLVAELFEVEMGDPVGVGEEVDAAILPFLTVRVAIENGRPCRKAMMPAAPLMRRGAWSGRCGTRARPGWRRSPHPGCGVPVRLLLLLLAPAYPL
jgi:hypothetical protein